MLDTPISALIRRKVVPVQKETPLSEAFPLLRERGVRCLCVMDGQRVVGVFTDRDAVEKVYHSGISGDTPIEMVMDAPVVTVDSDTAISEAFEVMDKNLLRNLPLVGPDGRLRGLIRSRDLMEYVAELRPELVLNAPPEATAAPSREGA